jgi:hypothetical protein
MKDNHEIEYHYHDNGKIHAKLVVDSLVDHKPIDGIGQWFYENESIDQISQCKTIGFNWDLNGPEIKFRY